MFKLLTIMVLSLFLVGNAYATKQCPDYLIIDAEPIPLETNPLEPFFAINEKLRPTDGVHSTACWRGYVATFEVKENKLYVKKVEIEKWEEKKDNEDDSRSTVMVDVTDKVFPAIKDRELSWYSGALVLPSGNIVEYVHMGYGSTYENYRILSIQNGKVTKDVRFSHAEFVAYKKVQFDKYKNTEEYKRKFNQLMERNKENGVEFLESFLYSFDSEYYLSKEF